MWVSTNICSGMKNIALQKEINKHLSTIKELGNSNEQYIAQHDNLVSCIDSFFKQSVSKGDHMGPVPLSVIEKEYDHPDPSKKIKAFSDDVYDTLTAMKELLPTESHSTFLEEANGLSRKIQERIHSSHIH